MEKKGRGSRRGKETSEWGIAAVQAPTVKVLVEVGSSGQIVRESFQATPAGGKIRTHPQALYLPVVVGLLLRYLVRHHKEEFPGLSQKYPCSLAPQVPTFCTVFPCECPYVSSSKLERAGWTPIYEVKSSQSPRCLAFWEL